MELKFDFELDEVVYVKPADMLSDTRADMNTGKFVSYKIISRIYEELAEAGNGAKSYVVRHIDTSTPGGGKLYKFSESELMSKASYKALMELVKEKSNQNYKDAFAQMAGILTDNPYPAGAAQSASVNWPSGIGGAASDLDSTVNNILTSNSKLTK